MVCGDQEDAGEHVLDNTGEDDATMESDTSGEEDMVVGTGDGRPVLDDTMESDTSGEEDMMTYCF